jgi:hypothetical protein
MSVCQASHRRDGTLDLNMGGDPVETLSDNDVPGWWEELGPPGLIDIHIPAPADDATRMSALRRNRAADRAPLADYLPLGPEEPASYAHRRHPRLVAVVAHMGAPEYTEFLDLAGQYPWMHLDTTMVFTDFFEAGAPFPSDLPPRLAALADRVVLGADFPNSPCPYAHQREALERLRDKEPASMTTGCGRPAGSTGSG